MNTMFKRTFKYFQPKSYHFRPKKSALRLVYSCGIVAYVGDGSACDYILEGLKILRSRGYDSAGISTLEPDKPNSSFSKRNKQRKASKKLRIRTAKFASVNTHDSYQTLEANVSGKLKGFCGIGHTRWATHGAKTDANAHPHEDGTGTLSLVHNGTIENCSELKAELGATGLSFRSETDSEVIVQLISFYYRQKGSTLLDAVQHAANRLEGTFGLAILCSDLPGSVIAVRCGSPLVLGVGEGRMWVASESSAFARHTKKYVALRDGEIAVVTKNGVSVDTNGRLERVQSEEVTTSPAPYEHWTLKEIMEQPAAINRALNNGGRIDERTVKLGGLDSRRAVLEKVKHLVICASGSSYYASLYASKAMRHLKSFDSVQVINASEFEVNVLPEDAALLVVSQSGETRDVIKALNAASEANVTLFSVVNTVGSHIARTTCCGVYTNAGRENAVPSTKAFSNQVVVLLLVALWFSSRRSLPSLEVKREEVAGELLALSLYAEMALQTRESCREIAAMLTGCRSLFVLGKGCGEAIAMEAALKIKEIAYIHAEGFSAGDLKHGPFSLIEKGTPVFAIVLEDKYASLMRISCREVSARGADLFIITDNPELAKGLDCHWIRVPRNGTFSALLAVIPFQLIAYYIALEKGINPDMPRNLAKSVTVD